MSKKMTYWIPKLYQDPHKCLFFYLFNKRTVYNYDLHFIYNHIVTKSIHAVTVIKCGYWKTHSLIFLILILLVSSDQPLDCSTLHNYHSDSLQRHRLLTTKLLNLGFLRNILILSFDFFIRKMSTFLSLGCR